jgi:hypothetical protein
LGSGNIRFEGDKIVGLWKDLKCHCDDGPYCSPGMSSVGIACINAFCDYVNCIGRAITSFDLGSCGNERAEANLRCSLYSSEQ